MSIYKNGKLVAGGSQALPLLCFMWSDHQLNHPSWLNSITFSWQAGSVYQAAYAHLADDITGKTLQSETISGTTIQFYLADDGHKICPASEESNVTAIYNATGVAWYYIIDTTNQRFKLPRTKFGFTGIRSGVGGYVEPAIPNIKGGLYRRDTPRINRNIGNAYREVEGAVDGYFGNSGAWAYNTIELNASLCSDVYKDDATTVQPPATEMYLYFYVGNFTQTALENTAGVTTEALNGKTDTDLANITTEGKVAIISLLMPDYSKVASISLPYTAPKDGWVSGVLTAAHSENYWVKVNNYNVQNIYGETNQRVTAPFMIPVSAGDVVSTTGGTGNLLFYPCKGA